MNHKDRAKIKRDAIILAGFSASDIVSNKTQSSFIVNGTQHYKYFSDGSFQLEHIPLKNIEKENTPPVELKKKVTRKRKKDGLQKDI